MSKKKILLPAAIILIIAVFAASGFWYINRFDASDYVQAVLDVSYKKNTDMYTKITGMSEEEAKKIFDENLDKTMEEFRSLEMPDALVPLFEEMFEELAMRVSYTVGETEINEQGEYIVPVNIKPVTLFSDTYETFRSRAEAYAGQITESVMQGADMPSEEEMQEEICRIYYQVLRERMDSGMLYGGVRTVNVNVSRKGIRGFEIYQADLDKVDSMLIEPAAQIPE